MDDKVRQPFILFDTLGMQIGHGVYYPHGGNVQVYMDAHGGAAWQFASLGEVMLLDGVRHFRWVDPSIIDGMVPVGNDIDGAYDPAEFKGSGKPI